MTPRAWNSTLPMRRERPRSTKALPMAGGGAGVLHPGPFRSQLLRDHAEGDSCAHCGAEDGTTIPAHSNHQEDGKGMGLKAHDLTAHLCARCHAIVDGVTPGYTQDERDLIFYRAVYKTTVRNLQRGFLKVWE